MGYNKQEFIYLLFSCLPSHTPKKRQHLSELFVAICSLVKIQTSNQATPLLFWQRQAH